MQKRALVPLAAGFEEMEAVIIIDVLRRAEVEVTVAGLEGAGPVLGSRGVSVVAEADLADALGQGPFDAVVLPGGLGGTHALRDDPRVVGAVRTQAERGALVAAVCAAPLVLARAGLADGRALTCHPSVREELAGAGARTLADRVVRDRELLTSQGPGTAMEFALGVVEELRGPAVAASVGAAMCL